MERTPLLLVSDGPQEATGLGRIARDLAAQIVAEPSLEVDLLQVGGPVLPTWDAWPRLPLVEADRAEDWGARFVEAAWYDRWGRRPGVLWLVWDPARLVAYPAIDVPAQRWAYTPIDSYNVQGGLSGAPAAALTQFDRVLAYGRWASTILKGVRRGPVPYLPHGIDAGTFGHPADEAEQDWVREQLGAHWRRGSRLVGCVATNQARKDLALVCETIATLRARGHQVHLWLHTDRMVKAWSLPQLVHDTGLGKTVTVTLGADTVAEGWGDRQLACLYQACGATIAPGLGEGFGYPIVESLASGTAVVHGDFAGGRELVPKREWRFPVREVRRESIYGLTRPVFRPEDVANAVERVWQWQAAVGEEGARAYCKGAVAHLDWTALWPRWRSWIRQGL